MRRLVGAGALAVIVLAAGAPPATAADAGVVTATSTYSGNDSCFETPGPFSTTLEFVGTLAAGGQTYVGPFRVDIGGTYVQGQCSIRDVHGGLDAQLMAPGSLSGSTAVGRVAGTCSGGNMEFFAVLGLTALPEPQLRGHLSLGCEVSVNGAASSTVYLTAPLVGQWGAGSATHTGAYTIT